MSQILESLCESANFQPGDRVKTLRGATHGVIKRILDDGRVVWQPEGTQSELTALPESLLREKKLSRE
jgi:transcription elongation factor